MKFAVLIYVDPNLRSQMPDAEFKSEMRTCIAQADEMRDAGTLYDAQMLEDPSTAKSIRVRNGKTTTFDGPFAETKEVLGGFNIIEAKDMDEAMKIAMKWPWSRIGAVEVRPVRDIEMVRTQVQA